MRFLRVADFCQFLPWLGEASCRVVIGKSLQFACKDKPLHAVCIDLGEVSCDRRFRLVTACLRAVSSVSYVLCDGARVALSVERVQWYLRRVVMLEKESQYCVLQWYCRTSWIVFVIMHACV